MWLNSVQSYSCDLTRKYGNPEICLSSEGWVSPYISRDTYMPPFQVILGRDSSKASTASDNCVGKLWGTTSQNKLNVLDIFTWSCLSVSSACEVQILSKNLFKISIDPSVKNIKKKMSWKSQTYSVGQVRPPVTVDNRIDSIVFQENVVESCVGFSFVY